MTVSAYAAAQPRLQFTDSSGNFLNGGKLYVYAAGTITKATTYQDAGLVTPNTDPIILDSVGRTPFGLFLPPGNFYKFTLAPSTDTDPPTNPIWTVDNIGTSLNGTPYATDSGSLNAMAATVVGLPLTPTVGTSVIIDPANSNTLAATLNVTPAGGSAWGAISIRNPNGNTLGPSAYVIGSPITLTYDGTYWRIPTFAPGDMYGVDTGTANNIAITISGLPATTPLTGVTFSVKAAHSNTSSTVTVTVNSWMGVTMSNAAGTTVTAGAYVAGQVFPLTYDGTNMRTLF